MDIAHYISRLLFRYDCVIVPGLGGFITNYNPANYRSDIHLFEPPSKVIAFNENLTTNDGLLTNFIAECNQCTYSESQISITQFIQILHADLDKGNVIIFESIGSFTKKTGNLVFTPDHTINRLIDAFGLPVLQMPLSEKEMARAKYVSVTIDKNNVVKKALFAIPLVLALAFIPMKMSHFNISPTRYAAGLSQFNETNNVKNLLNNPTSVPEAIDKMTEAKYALYYSTETNKPFILTAIDTLQNLKQDTLTNNSSEEIIIHTTEQKSINTPASDKRFFLIAGSFVEMTRVNVFCKELTNKNFTPELVDRDNKLRVSIGSYFTSEEANKALIEFRQEHPEYPVWLLGI